MSNFESFRSLHFLESPLLLADAWDLGSALLFESLGAPAIATTSAGVSWALGYPDGSTMPSRISWRSRVASLAF